MGSRSTKVATPPHVKAVASPGTPVQHQFERGNNANEPTTQYMHQVSIKPPQSCDDIDLRGPTQLTVAWKRRHSDPGQAMTTVINADRSRHLDAWQDFVATRDLMAIDLDHADLPSAISAEYMPVPNAFVPNGEDSKVSNKTEEPEVQCVVCCTHLPQENDPRYIEKVIKPCRSCNSAYCVSCVKGMFLSACKDSTRMPPRCCVQIHLHHVKPHMTTEEIADYRSKYEEWSTPKPFYCPVSTCSVFIPERLLPLQTGSKGKRKVDSGIGTPTSPQFQCPNCAHEICVDCRQAAHPGSICAVLDFGVDADTAALLKAWGYKRCPKCSQGLKRMYGCNHMECRCGAHFCWGCLESRDECDGGCYGNEDEDYGSESEPDEAEPLSVDGDSTGSIVAGEQTASEEEAQFEIRGGESVSVITPGTSSRPRNLDGGSSRYWEEQDLHFGDEPNDDNQNRVWECRHSFEPFTLPFASLITPCLSAHEMECVRCWCTVRPEIELPQDVIDVPPKRTRPNHAAAGRPLLAAVSRRGHDVVGHRAPTTPRLRHARYVTPRGLFRLNATVGTAPHLTTRLPSVSLAGTVLAQIDPMEDVQSKPELDSGMKPAGLSSAPNNQAAETPTTAYPKSNVFGERLATYNYAQECRSCSLLVCQKCVDNALALQKAEREAAEAESEEEEEEADADAKVGEDTQDRTEVPVPAGLESDEDAPPSLFD